MALVRQPKTVGFRPKSRYDIFVRRLSKCCCNRNPERHVRKASQIMGHNLSYYCLLAPCIYIFVLRTHPVCGESHNQRNASGEVATVLKKDGNSH